MSKAGIPLGAMNIFLLCHLYHLLEHFPTCYSRNQKLNIATSFYNAGIKFFDVDMVKMGNNFDYMQDNRVKSSSGVGLGNKRNEGTDKRKRKN